ncbi:early nodulin-like protein 14 [Lolium perenne]|uniref:early nodulin-like protein 14 n=1 Tax=Lolium perenne TaxID=4522 RepID=UPI003A98E73C
MATTFLLSAVVAACAILASVSASSPRVLTVGGDARGWRQPAPGEETYNHWASRSRFHVGDLLYFRYAKNDSVLVVTRDDYKVCRGDRPALRLDGGEEARLRLERSGPLYFISGAPGHCDAGQRLTVRVMAQHDDASSSPADAPAASTRPGSGSGAVKAGDGKTSAAAASVRASVGDVLSQPLGFVAERHFVEQAAGVREGRPAATAARQSTRARAPPGEARRPWEARRGRERRVLTSVAARGEVESGGRRGDDGDPAYS